ncbi:MAG: YjgP/YjgQ family permease [Saprospiraceae bacterium]|nr:YjgP/YjgQ family permease [Saprospiraceae bacterium]
MLKKIDRYFFRQYIKTFFFTAIMFSLIAVVIDFSDRLDSFIKNGVSVRDAIFSYYLHFIAMINGLLWPLFALISVIFFTSRLAKNSEIISILNAGIPFRRIVVPYMAAATFIFSIHLLANHFLIPMGSKIRIPFENKNIWKNVDQTRTRNIHLLLDPKTKLYISNYRQRDTTALDMRIEKYDEDGQLIEFIEAKKASWLGPPDRWQLANYRIHRFDGMQEEIIERPADQIDTTVNIRPDELNRVKNQQQLFTSPELQRYLNNQRSRGIGGTRIFETELYRRTSEPFSIYILTLIGLAVASRKTRGGLGIHLAIGVSLGALFILLSRFTMTFTNSESLGPIVGVWLPNIVFSAVAIYLLKIAQK